MKKLITTLLAVLIWTVAGDDCLAVDDPDLQFTQVSKFRDVWDITNAGDGSGRLFLIRQYGRINIIEDGQPLATPFLDIGSRIVTDGDEMGLLSMTFAPDYKLQAIFTSCTLPPELWCWSDTRSVTTRTSQMPAAERSY